MITANMKAKDIRKTREYRIAMIKHKRKNPRCIVCGTIKGRVVHHKDSMSYFPEKAIEEDNLVTLCDYRANNCHGSIHIDYKGGYRKKTTKKDFEKWLKIINHKEKIKK
jgi:hypothetical protein